MKIKTCNAVLFLGALASCSIGCNVDNDDLPRTVNASGTITLNGEPVIGASIVAMSESGGNSFARAISDSSGRFSLDAFESKKGAVPGSYKITASKTVEVASKGGSSLKSVQEDREQAGGAATDVSWANELPSKYNNPSQSGLKVTVPEDGISDIKLELKK